ncbi:hypothetical protein A1O7_07063 [Cladophialophora yegresii CBS 114405]|uniref:C2H2-type domain-containing protein n=1 Tax=Cladophialophora yegresii CBS 114405 TaxID=1182544 RepID=W9WDW4_9EURO|nr:uncharacterized protein A1O7_07063 [Cladophialophora yegresii CBS 114405]EXJ56719.1 hypothetical protein A1O7_07063 [Cladophialophora yegresii CBS 114405]
MVKARSNQLYINHDTRTYFCRSCDRHFSTENGALDHCRHAHIHRGECRISHSPPIITCASPATMTTALPKASRIMMLTFTTCVHNRTHLPANIECLGCDREFSEFAAMMIHLESGTCASGIDRDNIDNWVFESDPCYLYGNWWEANYKYQCPGCGNDFRFVSGLCQHVATDACDWDPEETFEDIENAIACNI